MRLEVPFFKQTTDLDCGPTALRMVISYFGKDPGIQIIKEKAGIKEGKGVFTIQLATAAVFLGFKADFFSKHVLFNEEYNKMDFYKKYAEMDLDQSKKVVKDAEDIGVKIQERTLSINEVLRLLTKESVPIILLDWNIVTGNKEKGYQGHFVPIIGYDSEKIYVHNGGSHNPEISVGINKKLFDEARKAKGTDEDLVVIYKK